MERILTALVVAEGHLAYIAVSGIAPYIAWRAPHIAIYLYKHPRLPYYLSDAFPQTNATPALLYRNFFYAQCLPWDSLGGLRAILFAIGLLRDLRNAWNVIFWNPFHAILCWSLIKTYDNREVFSRFCKRRSHSHLRYRWKRRIEATNYVSCSDIWCRRPLVAHVNRLCPYNDYTPSRALGSLRVNPRGQSHAYIWQPFFVYDFSSYSDKN